MCFCDTQVPNKYQINLCWLTNIFTCKKYYSFKHLFLLNYLSVLTWVTISFDETTYSGYIFNTEAHPVDISSLKCCQKFHSTETTYHDILAGVFGGKIERKERNAWKQMLCASQNYHTKILKLSQVSLQD